LANFSNILIQTSNPRILNVLRIVGAGQNFLWTSGAPILKKDKTGKVVSDSIFWCSTNETTKILVSIPAKNKIGCLAFVKATGGFELKNCTQKAHFVCEVKNLFIVPSKIQ